MSYVFSYSSIPSLPSFVFNLYCQSINYCFMTLSCKLNVKRKYLKTNTSTVIYIYHYSYHYQRTIFLHVDLSYRLISFHCSLRDSLLYFFQGRTADIKFSFYLGISSHSLHISHEAQFSWMWNFWLTIFFFQNFECIILLLFGLRGF